MGVLRDPSGFQTSYPEVKWGGQPHCQRRGKDLAGARQRTANEHPPTRVLPFCLTCHATSRVTVTQQSHTISRNVTREGNALVTQYRKRLRENFLKDLEKFLKDLEKRLRENFLKDLEKFLKDLEKKT